MPGPLIAVDAPSLLYRAFHALPRSITGPDGTPVNALLGTANLVLQARRAPRPARRRAVLRRRGGELPRRGLSPATTPTARRCPTSSQPQWDDAPAFFGAFDWTSLSEDELEADDLLGSLADVETDAGGRALLFTGDRDMFQCVGDRVAVLCPAGKGETGRRSAPTRCWRATACAPTRCPTSSPCAATRPTGCPGRKGIGEKTARDLLRDHETLEALLAAAASPRTDLRPRQRAALTDDADAMRAFRDIATLRHVDLERPPDAPTTWERAAEAARERGMNRLADRLAANAA